MLPYIKNIAHLQRQKNNASEYSSVFQMNIGIPSSHAQVISASKVMNKNTL
jgi:hypothetical protein